MLRDRRSVLRTALLVLFPPLMASVPSAVQALPSECVEAAGKVTCTYMFTGGTQQFTVPATGVASITVDLYGGSGGDVGYPTALAIGGKGAHVTAELPVTGGTTYDVEVGGEGGLAEHNLTRRAYNGGGDGQDDDRHASAGGGGASDLRLSGGGLAGRVLVAGGGGGAAFAGTGELSTSIRGGDGGDSGHPGEQGQDAVGAPNAGGGGGAGSQSSGGSGGTSSDSISGSFVIPGSPGADGTLGQGADAGEDGAAGSSGGGGGGGYYGGGSGGGGAISESSLLIGQASGGGGGGGGSSYVTPTATSSSVVEGDRSGNGLVVISYISDPSLIGPTVTINQASGQSDPATTSRVLFDVVFSEDVTGFDGSDVVLTGSAGATTASVTGSGASYQVSVSGMTQSGDVIAAIAAGAAQDGDSNDSAASTSTDNTVAYQLDSTAPTVTINQQSLQDDPTSTSPILFDVIFSEPVTGFDGSDVVLSGSAGATTASFTGSGASYQVSVSGMTQSGDVIASIGAGAAKDGVGNDSVASTSTDNTVAYEPDTSAPTVTIDQASGQADPATTGPILFDVAFSEDVTGFDSADVVLSGSAGATTAVVTGSGASFEVSVSGMTQSGDVIASIGAGAAKDGAGNDSVASTSTDNTVTYEPDASAPTVTIDEASGQADPTTASPVAFDVVFSESVTGFEASDVQLSGTAGATTAVVTGTGPTYRVNVSGMTQPGSVTATIAAGAAKDAAGNDAAASTSTDNTVTFRRVFTRGPTASISGLPRVGSTLTAGVGSPSPAAERFGYRWFADGLQITGATGRTFKLTSAQHRKRITVKVFAIRTGYVTATDVSDPTPAISALTAKHISLEPDEDLVRRGQRVDLEIHGLASNEPWGLFFDGVKIGSGRADSRGNVDTSFVVPSRAASGDHRLRANGAFLDRTDTDIVTVK